MAEGQEHAQGQGVDPVITAWQAMTAEIAQLNHAFTTQGISSTVQKFDGNPKNFREWVKSIEKYAILVNMPDHRKRYIAYQTSGGAVSGFIQRYIHANPDNTWQQLKDQLSVRFSYVTDRQMALSLLRSVKQKTDETIQVFAERILSLAEMAYLNQGGDAVERQLIDIFIDGITNDPLKMKILRDQPNTLQGAIAIATNEQNLRVMVQMTHSHAQSSHHEPMEVDHSRGQRFRGQNHPNRFNRINSANPAQNFRQIKCWNCGMLGHVSRDCGPKDKPRPSVGHGRPRQSNYNQQEN